MGKSSNEFETKDRWDLIVIICVIGVALIAGMCAASSTIIKDMTVKKMHTVSATTVVDTKDGVTNETTDNDAHTDNTAEVMPVSDVSETNGVSDTTPTDNVAEATPQNNATVLSDKEVYYINTGDTLSDISRNVGVSVQKLAKTNMIDDVNLIYSGSALQIER